jgi:hypothetical protein
MDFGSSAARLRKDHEKLRSLNRNRNTSRTLASNDATSKAKKVEEYRKQVNEKKKQEDLKQKKMKAHVQNGFDQVERKLGVIRQLGSQGRYVSLKTASVHGLGDKITLPPSILSTLAERDLLSISQERGQPLFFRLGIRRTDDVESYSFPQSDSMKALMEEYGQKMDDFDSSISIDDADDDDEYMIPDDDDGERESWMKAYLDELSCQYISYTYATVVEFSQDEDHIGLPFSVANALLHPDGSDNIDSRLTVDPAEVSMTESPTNMDVDDDKEGGSDKETAVNLDSSDENLEDKTPGHAAYGLFPVPVSEIEVTLLTHLPLGSKCTLQPTVDAIKQGFYNVKNVKLALEQSLTRTRGSLNVGDLMHCWFRGKKFDLNVHEVIPSDIGAISCVNCDIEVDIAPLQTDLDREEESKKEGAQKLSGNASSGHTLKDDSPIKSPDTSFSFRDRNIDLPSEPDDQKDNVVMIQIRGAGKIARRRFDTQNTVKNLFDFAISSDLLESSVPFKLVTRFPRRVFVLDAFEEDTQLAELGLAKQEMFMVERM